MWSLGGAKSGKKWSWPKSAHQTQWTSPKRPSREINKNPLFRTFWEIHKNSEKHTFSHFSARSQNCHFWPCLRLVSARNDRFDTNKRCFWPKITGFRPKTALVSSCLWPKLAKSGQNGCFYWKLCVLSAGIMGLARARVKTAEMCLNV